MAIPVHTKMRGLRKHNGLSSPTVDYVGSIDSPRSRNGSSMPGTAASPARISSPLDPPNSAKRRANVNNEHTLTGSN